MNFLNEFPHQARLPAVQLFLLAIWPQCLVCLSLLFIASNLFYHLLALADEWATVVEWVLGEGMGYFHQLSC